MAKSILLITSSYPSQGEGASAAGVFVKDFAIELARNGYDVSVVAPGKHGHQYAESGVLVTEFGTPGYPLSLLNPLNPMDWLAILSTIKSGFSVVDQVCHRKAITHILAFWAVPCGMWASYVGRKFSIPYSVWCLGSDIWKYGRIPLLRYVLGKALRGASVCYADGMALARDVSKIGDVQCRFLASSRNMGIPSRVKMASRPPYKILYLGRWHINKGVDILMDSLSGLATADWGRISAIRIVGGGPLEKLVKLKVQKLQDMGYPISISGYVDKDEAYNLLHWADFVVIPSRIESIPVVFSDAMQCGCPVIAMPVGDFPQLLSEHMCGVLAEECDAASFTVAISKALELGADRFQPGVENAADLFSLKHTVSCFIDVSIGATSF